MTSLKDRPSSSSLRDEKGVNGDPVTKQAILANEKRRRRRESHNAVERRRRDNINEKISELATLIPECMLDPSGKFYLHFRYYAIGDIIFTCTLGISSDLTTQLSTGLKPHHYG
jgi:Helix-loop-helix DNA-binding domain